MFGLDRILHPLTVNQFLSEYIGRKGVYIPGSPEKFQDLYGWKEVNTVLNNMRPTHEGVRLVHDTKSLPNDELRRMGHWLAQGATLVVNHVQDIDPVAEQVAGSLANDMNAAVNINCYVSFPARQGFDNHYDTHDVFILQTAGKKVWKVFEPTERKFPLDRDPGDQKKRYTRPTDGEYISCELQPGDVLYIPRGHWHYAVSSEACIHLTVSYNNRSSIDFLQWMFNEWREHEEFLREDFPLCRTASLLGDRPPEALDAHLARFRAHVANLLQGSGIKEHLLRWAQVENPIRTPYRLPELASLDKSPLTQEALFQVAPNQKIVARHDPASGRSELLARGRVVALDKAPRAVFELMLRPGATFSGAQLVAAAPGITWESLRGMLTSLFVNGLIVLVDAAEV